MIYQPTDTMALTYNCLALATSGAVTSIALLKDKITFVNGNYCFADLCTGEIIHYSKYRKNPTHNKINDDPKKYKITPVYFDDPDNSESNESLYRHGKVHILNAVLSAYHRDLFVAALQRAAVQDGCDLSEARVHMHHVNGNKRNNSICNLLPVTDNEHYKIHNALRCGASTYEALVAGLGENLVLDIFGADYFNYGDSSVYTAAIKGIPYIQLMLSQLSAANLPADTKCLRVQLLNGKYSTINIFGLNIYELLSALYNLRVANILKPCTVKVTA